MDKTFKEDARAMRIYEKLKKWLAPKDYKDKDTLQEVVINILQKLGKEYKINFKS